MENSLEEFVEVNIKDLFGDFKLIGKEHTINYNQDVFGRIDLLLKHKVENKFIIIEINYNKTNEESITQINKYFTYFVKNHKLNPERVRRILIDVNISKEIQELCRHSNIEYKIVSKNIFNKWKEHIRSEKISIGEQITKSLKSRDKPISTRELALQLGFNWNTIIRHCLKLQLEGKVEGMRLSNINFWRIKNENKN